MQIPICLCVVVVGCLSMSLENPNQKITYKRSEAEEQDWDPKNMFDEIDVDGNGYLTFDEVARKALRMKPDASYGELMTYCSRIMHDVDLNGDGKIQINEFMMATTS